MAARLIHRSSARRMARGWYAAALVVALAGGALWAFELPAISAPAAGEPPAPAPLPPLSREQPGPQPPASDVVIGTAERLEIARVPSNRPAAAPAAEPPPVAAGVAWKYLGSITEPTRRVALVSINNAQRMLAQGRTIVQDGHTFTLVEVNPDSIVVEDNGQRLVIQKEARTGPLVAWVSPQPGGGVIEGMNGAVGAMSGTQPVSGRAMGGGIDPGEAERMREQIHARRGGVERRGSGMPIGKSPAPGAIAPTLMSKGMRAGNNAARGAENAAGDASAEDGTVPRGPMP